MSNYTYDRKDSKTNWLKTELKQILENMQEGDILETPSPLSLACSMTQILEIFQKVLDGGLEIEFFTHRGNFNRGVTPMELLTLLSLIQNKFISIRTKETQERRRDKGLPLGRPKGKQNASLKLDPHRVLIMDYLARGVSKASLARILDCHPQTLYGWLRKEELIEMLNRE